MTTYHTIIKELLTNIKSIPARVIFENYIRSNNLHSSARKTISDLFFDAVRYYGAFQSKDISYLNKLKNELTDKDLKPTDFEDLFGLDKYVAEEVMRSLPNLNTYKFFLSRAPLTIRVNPQKTTREQLMVKLMRYKPLPTKLSPFGIILEERTNVRQLNEFKKGMFELQDEGSQLIYNLMTPKPGEKVLDLCAGTGGKSLMLQSCTYNTLYLDAYDISSKRLAVLKKRADIAGVKVNPIKAPKERSYDKVLIDAPCSGSGVLRRDVDNLLRLNGDILSQLINIQRNLLEQSITLVKNNGLIFYVTCSFLKCENEENIEYIINKHKEKISLIPAEDILEPHITKSLDLSFYLKTFPNSIGMDGFFGAVLRVKK
ncbi:MAG: RsmB/NOP family class I SAM-dependent RNA methyltransferase [Calditerrivibrio sp.]|nr:RsmB/NOP family class I SAM-dependent RNA methyltransferase [Calditerrivibrio sp.]